MQRAVWTSGLVVAVLAASVTQVRAADLEQRVALSGQRVTMAVDAKPARLTGGVTVHNRLAVRLASVEVGILFASSPEALDAVTNVRGLYLGEAHRPDVGVVRVRARVDAAPRAETPVTFEAVLTEGAPEPAVYFTHLLGYQLASAPPALLFELLETDVPADEVAAVDYLGLAGDGAERWAARGARANDPGLLGELLRRVMQPTAERRSLAETRARVYALRGLGVLGGAEARSALQAVAADANLGAFDEPLQVLRVARLVGSRIENPLAFAIPADARKLGDVARAALADAEGLVAPAVAAPVQPEAASALDASGVKQVGATAAGEVSTPASLWLALGALGVAGVLVLFVARRRRVPRTDAREERT